MRWTTTLRRKQNAPAATRIPLKKNIILPPLAERHYGAGGSFGRGFGHGGTVKASRNAHTWRVDAFALVLCPSGPHPIRRSWWKAIDAPTAQAIREHFSCSPAALLTPAAIDTGLKELYQTGLFEM